MAGGRARRLRRQLSSLASTRTPQALTSHINRPPHICAPTCQGTTDFTVATLPPGLSQQPLLRDRSPPSCSTAPRDAGRAVSEAQRTWVLLPPLYKQKVPGRSWWARWVGALL